MSEVKTAAVHYPNHEAVRGLYEYALLVKGGEYNPFWAPQHFEVSEELEKGGKAVEGIANMGPQFVADLQDSDWQHDALDSLNTLERIRHNHNLYGQDIRLAVDHVDAHPDALAAIIEGDDQEKAIKALRYVFSRIGTISPQAVENFDRFFPRIAALSDRGNRRVKGAKELYHDILEGLSAPFEMGAHSLTRNKLYFERFAKRLGYSPTILARRWERNGKTTRMNPVNATWAKRNIATMLALEHHEPGMCRALTDTFKTFNFARQDPRTHIDMYEQKRLHPEWPLVLSLKAGDDHNLAFASNTDIWSTLCKRLTKRKVRVEEYECHSIEDIFFAGDKLTDQYEVHGSQAIDVVIDAHGSSSDIFLTEKTTLNERTARHLADLTPALAEGARVLLGCCSAAREKGEVPSIGRMVAHFIERPTEGPRAAISVTPRLTRASRLNGNQAPRMAVSYARGYDSWWKKTLVTLSVPATSGLSVAYLKVGLSKEFPAKVELTVPLSRAARLRLIAAQLIAQSY